MSKNYISEQASGFIKDRYPLVKEITFEFHYHDPDGLEEDSEKIYHRLPNNYAYFQFECLYKECVGGGFDLNSEVNGMLRNREVVISGNKTCQGWQDKERVGQNRCWCKLAYLIKAEYK